jgi:MFS family permease
VKQVIRNGNFRLLWLSQLLLTLGDGNMQMGLLELFKSHGYDVRVETAKMMFALALPGFLLGPLTMAILDRWQRRHVMIITDVLRTVLVFVIVLWIMPLVAGRVASRDLAVVYVMIGVIGAMATFYLPARAALMPNLVEEDRLVKANTLFAITLAVAAIGGRALGGVVAVKAGVIWAIMANAVMSLASCGVLWQIRMTPHATRDRTVADKGRTWRDFRDGIQYLVAHHSALPLVFLSAVFAFLLGILMVVFLGYAVETLRLRTDQVGYLVAVGGLGAGVGFGVLYLRPSFGKSDWVPAIQLALAGLALTWLSRSQEAWVAAPAVLVLGAVAASVLIYIDARLQAQVEDSRRGAVFAARGMLTSLTMIVAFWLQFGTETFKSTPPETIMGWLATGTMLAAALTFLLLHRKSRKQVGRSVGARLEP